MKAFAWYSAGLVVYLGSLAGGILLNPRDMSGGSWTDPYLRFTTVISFLFCLLLPLCYRQSWERRLAWFFLSLLVLLGGFFYWYEATA